MVQGSGFRVQGLGFRVQGLGLRVDGIPLATSASSVRVSTNEMSRTCILFPGSGFGAHRLFVSLNSRLESNKEGEKVREARSCKAHFCFLVSGFRVSSLRIRGYVCLIVEKRCVSTHTVSASIGT